FLVFFSRQGDSLRHTLLLKPSGFTLVLPHLPGQFPQNGAWVLEEIDNIRPDALFQVMCADELTLALDMDGAPRHDLATATVVGIGSAIRAGVGLATEMEPTQPADHKPPEQILALGVVFGLEPQARQDLLGSLPGLRVDNLGHRLWNEFPQLLTALAVKVLPFVDRI